MNIIQLSIKRPIAVLAAVIMIVMFGWVSLDRIPIQLAPDVRQPVIRVSTNWPGAAPAEVEREIINRQEEVLKGIEGLQRMESNARNNQGNVELEFTPDADLNRSLLLVANRLDRVTGYPEEADEPTLSTFGTEDNSIAWFTLRRAPGNTRDLTSYSAFLQDVVQDGVERVDGVAGVNVWGATDQEMRIEIDPERLARYALTVNDVVSRLRTANASITGGDVDEGKRRYVVRTEGDFTTVAQVQSMLLRSDSSGSGVGRVSLGDIADVYVQFKQRNAIAKTMGAPSMTLSITGQQGANVIETMERLRAKVRELSEGPLKEAGLIATQIFDETDYIKSAINLVLQNVVIGGVLAIIVLLIFLRSWRPTFVVALSIPVSVIGSFVAMALLGRSLNVISLAGIAFAVGMVVDAAIVVLENIYRLRQKGELAYEAAYHGAAQVWPAVLVSALTTVMVFIPILVMDLEAGQLFRDIAVAISVSVLLSLLVSITLIPALANRMLAGGVADLDKVFPLPGIDHFGRAFTAFWVWFTQLVVRRKVVAVGVITTITAAAVLFSFAVLPKVDYLPTGNRNFVFGFISPPSGYNLRTTEKITDLIETGTREYWADSTQPDVLEVNGVPILKHYFSIALQGRAFVGGTTVDERRAGEIIPLLQNPARNEPGTLAFMFQPSLFGRSVGGGRSIDIDISGADLKVLFDVAQDAFDRVQQALPLSEGHRTRPRPGLDFGAPEVRVIPDRVRLADNGLTARDLGQTIDAFNDGLRVAEINFGGKRIDLTLAGSAPVREQTQAIGALPVVTRDGRIVSVESLADVIVTSGPTEIRRVERARTVTLQVSPSRTMPLQEAIDIINERVLAPMQAAGLPQGVRFNLSGSADKLSQTMDELSVDLVLALVIVFLVMAVLFESFVYPLIIMLAVPVAAAGGLGGLALLNRFVVQPLDMLTMLGFVILIGIVVNNAILLVHQTLHNIRKEGMTPDDAITEATRNRIRPIFSSTLTSVFGMLPLVMFPGAGSELYRGLGSVVVGGLALSAVLTMAIVPPMMSITVSWIEGRALRRGQGARAELPAA
ncbi:MAG: efflux RND transporter permease subunit [Alphaproteobacteria bacterium]|nr:efflux RND transporter permease subunit [Alphaproteobacteria bacterium]